ncbi:putative NUDIX hydrolase domain-containing protein [Lupinus albus]|uniref:Putative NUDIX hydrolase domain-containing protein n=1 Tax=Lupinus albus TaxID=3870 RepID=A0A6A4QSS7_LUPAL|nr:putative NUDIX hydrolase domain-containing protein [Lupinus albus]
MEKEVSGIDPSSFTLLVSCPSGISPTQVSVAFSDTYDRISHPDINLENSISEIWEQRSQNNKSLFNGKKFRYGGCTLHNGGGSDPEPRLCLQLGLTDYRTFVGTNLSPLWERFLVPSKDDPVLCQHTSSPLGNGAVVETLDNKIIVLQRSNNVGEFPGHFVFPGGHPEPQEIGIASHHYDKELTDSINGEVSREMFDSIIREVVEEIGVPPSSLSIPAFIGISRRDLNVRPAAFFFIKCSLDSKEVQQFYSSAQDGYESTQLYAVSMVDLQNMTSRMPGCHRGGFALYKSMAESKKNNIT